MFFRKRERPPKDDDFDLVGYRVQFRIVPAPHGKWRLEKTMLDVTPYPGFKVRVKWVQIGGDDYDSPEAARADFLHLFGTPPIPLDEESKSDVDRFADVMERVRTGSYMTIGEKRKLAGLPEASDT